MGDPGDRSALRRALLPLGSLALIALAALALLTPALRALVPPCLFRSLTGFYCPGCGTGRAMFALAHLDFATALRMNPFAVLAIGPMVYVLARQTLEAFGVPVARPVLTGSRWAVALAVAVFLFWFLRNVPVWPFSLLAPG